MPPDFIPPHPDPDDTTLARTALPVVSVEGPLYRIHLLDREPVFFGRTGRYRFDDPAGHFGVLYAAADPHGAFIETLAHSTGTLLVTRATLAVRGLARVVIRRPLRLVDLAAEGLAQLGADNRL